MCTHLQLHSHPVWMAGLGPQQLWFTPAAPASLESLRRACCLRGLAKHTRGTVHMEAFRFSPTSLRMADHHGRSETAMPSPPLPERPQAPLDSCQAIRTQGSRHCPRRPVQAALRPCSCTVSTWPPWTTAGPWTLAQQLKEKLSSSALVVEKLRANFGSTSSGST